MKASAYVNKANNASEASLVSPEFTIPANGATLSLSQCLNFLNNNNRADFVSVEVITKTEVTELKLSEWPIGSNYDFIDATADLSAYAGQSIQIVFHYKSTTDCAPTWEIKTLSIK